MYVCMYMCRSFASFACEWFCKLRLFAHVPSLGSNHDMRVCDIPSHAIGFQESVARNRRCRQMLHALR